MTPLEIQNQEFKKTLKGFNCEEVKHFLYLISEEIENHLDDNRKLTQEVAVLRGRVKDMEDRDRILKDTLITAQQIKDEIHENAKKDGQLIIREGQLKAEVMYEDAKKQVDQVALQIMDLRRTRNDILAEVEMMVARFGHFVDVERGLSRESDKLHNFILEPSPKTEILKEKRGAGSKTAQG